MTSHKARAVKSALDHAFFACSPDWIAANTRNGLPVTREGSTYWSLALAHRSGASSYLAHYDIDGNTDLIVPRWLVAERGAQARSIRRELQRRNEELRDWFKAHAFSNRSPEERPDNSLARVIRTCDLIPNVNVSRYFSVSKFTRSLFPQELEVLSEYRHFQLFKYSTCLGLEFECYGKIRRRPLADALPHWTRVVSDGSIRADGDGADGHEIRALLDRSTAEPKLFRLCNQMQQLGLRVNRSCGLHLHLDARAVGGFDEVVKIARVINAWLYAMRELLPASRRDNSFCKFGVATNDRYRAVNVASWSKYRTIEIRCHSATLDYTKVLAWVRLCELLRAMTKRPKAASCIATLEQLPLAAHDLAYWRARHRELNPSLYSTNPTDTTTDSE